MLSSWLRDGGHVSRCYFCNEETTNYCSQCNKSICNLHSKKPIEREMSYTSSRIYCPECFRIIEQQNTKKTRTIIGIIAVTIMFIAVGIILYLQFSG